MIYLVERGRPHGFSEKSNFTARQNLFRSLRESSSLVYADKKLAQHSLTLISAAKHAMKRKLNSEDVPEVVMAEGGEEQPATPSKATFASLNLDARLLQAITKEKFTEPTAVQAEAVPLALSGKDILGTSSDFWRTRFLGLTISSSIQDRLWQDPRLPLPNHTLHPATKGIYDKTSEGRFCADPGSHERAGIPGHFDHQDLHNFLRARSSRRKPHPERRHRRHSCKAPGTTRYRDCYAQQSKPMDQQ
jgi:hypothetical protein